MLGNDASIVNKFAYRSVSFQNRHILVFRPHIIYCVRGGKAALIVQGIPVD